jgi:hypothetical protein
VARILRVQSWQESLEFKVARILRVSSEFLRFLGGKNPYSLVTRIDTKLTGHYAFLEKIGSGIVALGELITLIPLLLGL